MLYFPFVRAMHAEEEGGKSEENLPLTAGQRPNLTRTSLLRIASLEMK
jgi:hypothetical protein